MEGADKASVDSPFNNPGTMINLAEKSDGNYLVVRSLSPFVICPLPRVVDRGPRLGLVLLWLSRLAL